MADETCNSQKSNFLASDKFLQQWLARNERHDQIITTEISQLGFLTDMQRSHRVANWAYQQAVENDYLIWFGGKEKSLLLKQDVSFFN